MNPPIQWTIEWSVFIGVTVLTVLYVMGWRRARRPGQPHPPGYGRLALFALSMLVTLLALISPIDGLSDDFMFIHMIQHMLLLDIMPILLILSLTKGIFRPVTRRVHIIERKAGPFAHPAFAVIAYVGLMALWHIPFMYDLALRHENTWHVLEHICFAAAGSLYWWHILSPIRSRMRLGGMGPVVYMAAAKLGVGVIGIILAFSPRCIYPYYIHHVHYWGLAPRVDQNLAGAIMALEQSLVMGVALVFLIMRMFGESETQARRAERGGDRGYEEELAAGRAALISAASTRR